MDDIQAVPTKGIGYVFRCTNKTQQECFNRMLFGEVESKKEMVSKIRKGDFLFLYNNDTGNLFGVFIAVSDGLKDIEKDAWSGKFKWQVKVEYFRKFSQPLPKHFAEHVIYFWGITKRHPREHLSIEKVDALIDQFEAYLPSEEEKTFRDKFPAFLRTKDGHIVRSMPELLIDNWLFKNDIPHGYEKKLNIDESVYCDFYIPKHSNNSEVYIEYWGLEDDLYLKRKKKKIEIYKRHGLPLIELNHDDLLKIDEVLWKKLKQNFSTN